MLPDCSRECLLKKISWGSMPPNPPSKLTAAPLDRQISVFMGNTQSHPCISSWNNLPFGIEKVDSVEGFKLKLKEQTFRSP